MMKKILAGLMASLMGIFAVGCRNQSSDQNSETPENAAETTAAPENDAAVTDGEGAAKTTAAVTTAAADKAETVTKKPGETEEPVVETPTDE